MGNAFQPRREPNEYRIKDSPSVKSQQPSRKVGNFLSLGREIVPEDMERKWEYYHIIIFAEWT